MPPTRHGQGIQNGGGLASRFVSEEQPRLLSHHGSFDDCFRTIVVNGNCTILQESCKRFPTIPEVVDSLAEERSGPFLFVSFFEPASDRLDDRALAVVGGDLALDERGVVAVVGDVVDLLSVPGAFALEQRELVLERAALRREREALREGFAAIVSHELRSPLAAVQQNDADLVIFNHPLSPTQERNLERLLSCRVVARTGLILDIFAQRARTFEGKLQVELAQLRHLSTRLVRGWTHLERQKGGIGLRGPGETQLESDRRMLNARIKVINQRLDKVERQRHQGRRARERADVPSVSLVGYTNAGKSTLFNTLTGAQAYVADQLFATLDPTLRRVDVTGVGPLVLADTVGFIRHLPHDPEVVGNH